MDDLTVKKAPLNFWVAGLILALTQILAFGIKKPLGVSTQFAIIDSLAIHKTVPEYAENHPLISSEKYKTLGYGFWLDVGIIIGAAATALATGNWKIKLSTVWWKANHKGSPAFRLITGFIAGFLILLGSRLGHGCTSGQFASGWAQLSLSALPFTIGLFGAGMITAMLVYPKTPKIE
jgi:hypothetical protein